MDTRTTIFIGLLTLFSVLEALLPRISGNIQRLRRWSANFGLIILGQVLAQLILPFTTISLAYWAETNQYGVFHSLDLSKALETIVSIFILDLAIYLQHLVFHKVPIFWRLHRVHHSDKRLDASSAVRFHPIEIILSLGIKFALIIAFGFSAESILYFEIILSSMAIFNHSNFYIPKNIEVIIEKIFVTPDFHRIHHSVNRHETNSNYGFNLSIWDRLFKTMSKMSFEENEKINIGLNEYQDEKKLGFFHLLIQPFKSN